jgi:hypothetical protein
MFYCFYCCCCCRRCCCFVASKGHHIFPPFLERQLTPGCDALPCLLLLGGALLNRTVWVRALSDLLGTLGSGGCGCGSCKRGNGGRGTCARGDGGCGCGIGGSGRGCSTLSWTRFLVGGASSRLFWELICQGSRPRKLAPGWGLTKLEFHVVVCDRLSWPLPFLPFTATTSYGLSIRCPKPRDRPSSFSSL